MDEPTGKDAPPPPIEKPEEAKAPEPEVEESLDDVVDEVLGEPAPKADAPAPAEWPDDLLSRAAEYGLSEAEAKDYGAPAMLQKALSVADRALSKSIRSPAKESPTPPPEPPAAKKKFDLKLNKELFDPELVKALEEMQQHYESEVGELQTKVNGFVEAESRRQNEKFINSFDGWVNDLDESYQEVFGKGKGYELEKNSSELKSRVDLLKQMDVLAGANWQAMGRHVPDDHELFNMALRLLHGDKADKAVRQDVARKLKTLSSQSLAKPTHRASAELKGERLALANLTRGMRANGMLDGQIEDHFE